MMSYLLFSNLNFENHKRLCEFLQPYVTIPRQQKIAEVIAGRINHLEIALEFPYDPHNAAAVLRSSEALGIYNIHLIHLQTKIILSKSVTQGAYRWLGIYDYPRTEDFFATIKNRGIKVAGASLKGKMHIKELHVEMKTQPLCLLFGNEHQGLTAKAETACDYLYQIPMQGFTQSLNLSVSAAISLYTLKNEITEPAFSLPPEEQVKLQAYYFLQSVNPKLKQQALKLLNFVPEE